MVATAIKTKSHRLFDAMDENSNGVITADDFQRTADRLIQAFDASGSPDAQKTKNAYTKAWQKLAVLADSDQDGQVTKQEFEAVFASAGQGDLMEVVEEGLDAEFNLADTDQDGVLSVEEVSRLLHAFGVPQTDLREAATALDHNGDGRVTRQEYVAAMRDFYLSEDASAPNNQIFGRVRG